MEDDIDLGPCCACGGGENVRNMMMLSLKAPVPGTGWGCVVCHLPSDGAMAVVCDKCLEEHKPLVWAVSGWATNKQRILYSELSGEHRHNMSFHEHDDD